MKPLTTNRKMLTWLCILPAEKTTQKHMQIIYALVTVLLITTSICGCTSSLAFMYKYVSTNLEDSLYALFQVCANVSNLYMILNAFMDRRQIFRLFEQLSKIYDANSTPNLFQFMKKANEKSEWMWSAYVKIIMGGVLIDKTVSCSFSAAVCSMRYENFNSKCVVKPYKTVVPWNEQTPFGCFMEICFHILTGETYLILNATFLILFTSFCLHHTAFYERFRYSLRKWDDSDRSRNDKRPFCELVRFHISVKEFFSDSVEVYSQFILIQLICSMVFMACAVFQLDLQIRNPTFAAISVWMAFMVAALNPFVYCYFGKSATESFLKMADSLYDANWFERSVALQKYFLLAISNAQRPLFYHGFGVAILNLDTLTNMLKTVLSYYMMFKTITAD